MRLGLGHSLARRGFVAAAADPAAAYIAAITAAGATVTAPKQAAISTFISGEIAAGRWDGIKRLYFPVWGLAAANAICMKSLTTGTWTGGAVTHAAGYVYANRFGGYMDTNTTLASVGITKDTYQFVTLHKTAPFGGDNYSDITFGVSDVWFEVNDGNPYLVLGEEGIFIATQQQFGIRSIGGNASTRYIKNRTSGGIINSETNNQVISTEFNTTNVYFLRANGYGGLSSESQTGAFSMGTILSDAEDTAYTLNLQNLYNRIRFGIITGLDWQNYADETIAYVIELNKAGVAYV